MPASGARAGTRPSRSDRGAGDGQLATGVTLSCGHATDEEPIAKGASFAIYQCPRGCGLTKRAPRRATPAPKGAS